MKRKAFLMTCLALAAALCFMTLPTWAESLAPDDPIAAQGRQALAAGLAELKAAKGDPNLLVLTNAGYGEVNGRSSEIFLDLAAQETGRSQGTRSLLMVHSSCQTPLWLALYKKDSGRIAFAKWAPEGFKKQLIEADPAKLLTPDGWRAAASGPLGPSTFGVVSIALSWARGAGWPLLLAAAYHNHFCPGLNSGFLAAEYLRQNLALGPGDKYVFVGAPAKCAMDALQIIFDATMGKAGAYGLPMGSKAAAKYFGDKTGPLAIAMRVSPKADKCQGLVLGFDWTKVYADTGVKAEDFSPKGGPSNPLFWISRVKISAEMAALPLDKKMKYVVKVKEFSGPAALADQVALGGGDPYAVAWAH